MKRISTNKKALFLVIFSSFALMSPFAIAQEEASAPETPTYFDSLSTGDEKIYRSRKFINLTLGVEQDEKLPPMPDNFILKGDFRKIVSVSYSKEINVFRFTPLREGFGTLTVHDKRNNKIVAEYRVDVKKNKLDKVVREIQALLSDIEGITIKIVNNKVVVDGQILLPKDLSRIYSVVSQYGSQAASLVSLSPLAQKKIAEFISRDINNPEIEVRALNDKIVLQGWAKSAEEKMEAETIAKAYMPDVVVDAAEEKGVIKKRRPANDGIINLIKIKEAEAAPPKKMVQLVVHYVELSKSYTKGFNFQWTPTLQDQSQAGFSFGQGQPGGFTSQITGIIDNLLPKLNWAKSHGHAKVLESTSLIVEDGAAGNIEQMSKYPYSTSGPNNTQTVQFADVGISSNITPRIIEDKSASVKLDIKFAIGAMGSGGVITNNKVNTIVTVRDRQSAAIGGLITNSSSNLYNDPNKAAKNPIISLYASKDFSRNQSQFVVFVTPIVKTSASAGSEQIKKKFRLRD
ncbi:MAG: pilus assembly protein [Bdellovibrionia bacterium]